MKYTLLKFILGLLLFVSVSASAQIAPTSTATLVLTNNNDTKIAEVYGTNLPIDSPSLYLALMALLNNRISFKNEVELAGEKYPKLSSLPLLNKNNPSLTHDTAFDRNTFNPLKYNMVFFDTKSAHIYRFDGTDILIMVAPQTF